MEHTKTYGIDDKEHDVFNFATKSRNTVWRATDDEIIYQYKMDVKDDYAPTGWEICRNSA